MKFILFWLAQCMHMHSMYLILMHSQTQAKSLGSQTTQPATGNDADSPIQLLLLPPTPPFLRQFLFCSGHTQTHSKCHMPDMQYQHVILSFIQNHSSISLCNFCGKEFHRFGQLNVWAGIYKGKSINPATTRYNLIFPPLNVNRTEHVGDTVRWDLHIYNVTLKQQCTVKYEFLHSVPTEIHWWHEPLGGIFGSCHRTPSY